MAGGYFFTGLGKLREAGLSWATSDNLKWSLAAGARSTKPPTDVIAQFLVDHDVLAHGLAFATLAVELGFLLVLFRPRSASGFAAVVSSFHLGIYLTLGLDYCQLGGGGDRRPAAVGGPDPAGSGQVGEAGDEPVDLLSAGQVLGQVAPGRVGDLLPGLQVRRSAGWSSFSRAASGSPGPARSRTRRCRVIVRSAASGCWRRTHSTCSLAMATTTSVSGRSMGPELGAAVACGRRSRAGRGRRGSAS